MYNGCCVQIKLLAKKYTTLKGTKVTKALKIATSKKVRYSFSTVLYRTATIWRPTASDL
jgi:hypothetical protein